MSENKTKDWKKFREENDPDIDELDDLESEEENVALEHPSYATLEEKLTLAEQQAHENWEKATRAAAELENVRRRAERDIENAHRFGQNKFITSLLPVVDSIEQALQLVDKNSQVGMVEGLELTLKLMLDALAKQEVKVIDPQGELFDPQEHEAMSIQELPDAVPNSVAVVFQKGYKLNDRVIRPARVIVAKAKSTN